MSKGFAKAIAVAVTITFLVVGWTYIGGAQGIGRQFAQLQSKQVEGTQKDLVVVSVNGEPITLHTLEISAETIRLADPQIDSKEAFKIALEKTILNTALYQKARESNIEVSTEEAKALYEKTKETAIDNPVGREYFAAINNLSSQERKRVEDNMVEGYRQALTVAKWRKDLANRAVSQPRKDEIIAYLKAHPKYRNLLIVDTIYFRDENTADKVYDALKTDHARAGGGISAQFYKEARKCNPERQDPTERFTFLEPASLPNYAQDALTKGGGHIGLYHQGGGTYVLYLVKYVAFLSKKAIYEQAAQQIIREKQQSFTNDLFKRVLEQADIRIYRENLPEGVSVTKEDILRQLENQSTILIRTPAR